MLAAQLAALVAAVPLLLAQESGPFPPTEFDEVFELELTADSPREVESRGPSATVEYFVDFEGTLHIWTRSELDLSLRIEDTDLESIVGEDADSGGGDTPYVRVEVALNDSLVITAFSSNEEALGTFALHVVAAPETEATRAEAAAGRDALWEARRHVRSDIRWKSPYYWAPFILVGQE